MRCRREKLGHFICVCDAQTRKSTPPIGLRPPRSSKSSQTLLWDSWLLFFDVRLRYEIGDRKYASQEMESRCRSNVWIRDYVAEHHGAPSLHVSCTLLQQSPHSPD